MRQKTDSTSSTALMKASARHRGYSKSQEKTPKLRKGKKQSLCTKSYRWVNYTPP